MKRYLKRLISFCIFFMIMVVGAMSIRAIFIRSHSWQMPNNKHTVFMGASHINRAIDDSMMETAINWSYPSERYMFTYIKLKNLLPANPQLDTIFLELAPTDLWEDTDYKYHDLNEQTRYVKLYWPFFSIDNWKIYYREPLQVLNLIIGSLFETDDLIEKRWWNHMGNYGRLEEMMDTTQVKPNLVKSRGYGHEINYYYLHKIIQICQQYRIKLYFLETPTFHPDYFYDQQFFYNSYKKNFSKVEFIDYSKWQMDPSEMYDAHHLNHKGAVRFTQELKKRFHIN